MYKKSHDFWSHDILKLSVLFEKKDISKYYVFILLYKLYGKFSLNMF